MHKTVSHLLAVIFGLTTFVARAGEPIDKVNRFIGTGGELVFGSSAEDFARFVLDGRSGRVTVTEPEFTFFPAVFADGWKSVAKVVGDPKYDKFAPAPHQCPFTAKIKDGPELSGLFVGTVTDGVAAVSCRLKVEKGGIVQGLALQGDLEGWRFFDGWATAGTARLHLPPQQQTNRYEQTLGVVSDFRLIAPDQSACLRIAFDSPVRVSVLHRSGSPNLTVRLSLLGRGEIRAGQVFETALTIASHAKITDPNVPWRVGEKTGFVPFTDGLDIVRGSILDFTGLVPRKPCGTYGRLRVKNGHFEFEGLPGVRQRFFGVNLHSFACYQTLPDARKLVDLLVRYGYNAVRFHNFENEYMGLTKDSPDCATPVEARFEGLDNLVAACRERGVYLTVDLHVGRKTTYRALGIDKPGLMDDEKGRKGVLKYQFLTNAKARENLKTFARGFFNHVNPHTGNRYADEPTLMLVSVVNESPCCWHYGGKDADFCKLEYELMRELSDYIRREIKTEVPLTTCNGGSMPLCLQPLRRDFCDYVDDHFYYDHPQFPEKAKWVRGLRVPIHTLNRRCFAVEREIPCQALLTRLWDKPYVITEFNWCAPSLYRATAGLLVGAIAASQDWDGLWRYLWAHDLRRSLESGKHLISKLEVASDPLALATERAIACLYLRGDMKPLTRKAALVLKREEVDVNRPHEAVHPGRFAWSSAGWHAQFATAFDAAPAGCTTTFSTAEAANLSGEEMTRRLGATGEELAGGAVRIDRARNAFAVVTPRTCGVSVERGSFDAGPLSADCDRITTVWASAMDDEPLVRSGRILLTHGTRMDNEGDFFADVDSKCLLDYGKPRYMVPRAKAVVRFRADRPEELVVYALGTDGVRRGRVPATVKDGALEFACETERAPAAILYELVR